MALSHRLQGAAAATDGTNNIRRLQFSIDIRITRKVKDDLNLKVLTCSTRMNN
jgi:hypothetical protein